ncbi:putative oxidoreductase [Talaromyces proteolyticus]|uniref:Oxidoreductase n=1 Tax=Talaromyces proteolyticus TaxID=1131652 RepID=A0AAD4KZA2_9EURO|nr:putative oxidoreductase [Talaromyces proteolyticus]KAH8703364.1 putative oxidoreductase [Talaromyces proteolyticus]
MASGKPAIGFVGLGAMGFGMATNLVRQGYPVKGYDVFPASVERFKGAGGIPAASLKESAEGNPYYVCMVASAPQVQEVLFNEQTGIINVLPKNSTFLLCSTVPSAYAQSVEKELKARGRDDIFFIDSPVSGGASRAADGTLSIMAGGSDAALENGKLILQEMSDPKKLYLVPGGIGAGSNMKMVHQVLAAIHILGASEAMGLAARLGLEAHTAADAIIKSDAWTWMHENRLNRMLEEDWNPGASALTIILKDVGIITSTARLQKFPTPLSSTAEQVYLTGLVYGWGPKDDSAMVRMYTSEPIIKVNSTLSPEETSRRLRMVTKLMQYTNIVAAAEAVAFARHLNVDMTQFYDLVINAAGGSKMFNTLGATMIKGIPIGVAATGDLTVDDIVKELSDIVQEARDLYTPLNLATAALNQYLVAQRRGWGKEAATSIIRAWEI